MSEEIKIAREKAAVAAMTGAKTSMTEVLNRVKTLELALEAAQMEIVRLVSFTSPNAYPYRSEVSVVDGAKAHIAKIKAPMP